MENLGQRLDPPCGYLVGNRETRRLFSDGVDKGPLEVPSAFVMPQLSDSLKVHREVITIRYLVTLPVKRKASIPPRMESQALWGVWAVVRGSWPVKCTNTLLCNASKLFRSRNRVFGT